MDTYFVFFLCFVICNAESIYRISRQPATWSEAYTHCQEFGGDLATLESLENFRYQVQNNMTDIRLGNGMELWVGANLAVQDWKWEGEAENTFKDGHFYENKGCFHQQYWISGTKMDNLSPDACLNLCQWHGTVGLKKDYCLCEKDLRNISLTPLGVCHLKCSGSSSEMCGGLHGVSVYQPAKQTIFWAEGEPQDDNDCVLLRRKGLDPSVDLVSSRCQLQTRYLCSFSNDEKCGVHRSCTRFSTNHATWEDARTYCQSMNGHLAEIDTASVDYFDGLKIPPGSFWVALRRRRNWKWINDKPVSELDFFSHERGITSERTCAVLENINGRLGLAARSCELKKHYLCQYNFMKRDGAHPAPISLPITTDLFPMTEIKTTTTSTATTNRKAKENDGIGIDGENSLSDIEDTELDVEPSSLVGGKGLLNTCMYIVLGFVSGMVCVLVLGMIVYTIYRYMETRVNDTSEVETKTKKHNRGCSTSKKNKHTRLEARRRHPDDRSINSVSYSSKEDSIHLSVAPPPSDITYDSVYDQAESPFRRTQRLIRMGSANSWRHAQSRKPKSDFFDSNESDFTWRGMIGGKVEIINTELRQQNSDQSNSQAFGEIGYDLHNTAARNRISTNAVLEITPPIRKLIDNTRVTDLSAIEGIYDLPGQSDAGARGTDNTSGYQPESPERQYPSFLEIETKLDEISHEENIYASIKRTFQKMKEDTNRPSDSTDEGMMYTVKLN